FRCPQGVTLQADSEENCGQFRRAVQKIKPTQMGQLQVIVTGSGIGTLIEGFTSKLKERLDADNASDIADVKRIVERRLPTFYSNEVETFPGIDAESKLHKFVIAAWSPLSHTFEVWVSRFCNLVPISTYELAGVEDVLYDHMARRLYKPEMTLSQCLL